MILFQRERILFSIKDILCDGFPLNNQFVSGFLTECVDSGTSEWVDQLDWSMQKESLGLPWWDGSVGK